MLCTVTTGPLCKNCSTKYLIVCTEINSENDVYFCFDSIDEMYTVFDYIETNNEYCGIRFKPRSAIRFLPKQGDDEDEK